MNIVERAYFESFDPYHELHFNVGDKVRLKNIVAYKALGYSLLNDEELLEVMKVEYITDDGKQVRLYYDCVSLKQIPIEWIEPA